MIVQRSLCLELLVFYGRVGAFNFMFGPWLWCRLGRKLQLCQFLASRLGFRQIAILSWMCHRFVIWWFSRLSFFIVSVIRPPSLRAPRPRKRQQNGKT